MDKGYNWGVVTTPALYVSSSPNFMFGIGKGWNDIMYESMRCVSVFWSIYFIGLIIFGNIIMLNLFLAILLGNFDKARNYKGKHEESRKHR